MKRIFLFIVVNLLVILAISALIPILGIKPYLTANGIDYQSLLIFCALFGFVGAFISLQLSRWSAKQMMGVVLLDPQHPGSAAETKIVEMVQSLCTRAGLSTLPEIGIYRSPEVNAFATGPSKKRALLAISSGLLEHMDTRAVEGVLGHEISHIANGDMVTMTLVQGVVNTFVMFFARVIAFAIENSLERNRDSRRGGFGLMTQWILVMVLESALMFLASPIIYWVSRRREYRADAGSAKLNGPDTMIYALESLKTTLAIKDTRAPALAAFKINGHGNGLWSFIFSTHPSIDARIAALRNGRFA